MRVIVQFDYRGYIIEHGRFGDRYSVFHEGEEVLFRTKEEALEYVDWLNSEEYLHSETNWLDEAYQCGAID